MLEKSGEQVYVSSELLELFRDHDLISSQSALPSKEAAATPPTAQAPAFAIPVRKHLRSIFIAELLVL